MAARSGIVTAGGVLYVIFGLLGFLQVAALSSLTERAYVIVCQILLLATGIGLLLRNNWGRWLALGLTLLTWTLGSLGLLWLLVIALKSFVQATGPGPSRVGSLFLLCAVLAAYIWLSFRIFVRLISVEGREEFDTPEHESHAIAKSSALQVALALIGFFAIGSPGEGAKRVTPQVRQPSAIEPQATPEVATPPPSSEELARRAEQDREMEEYQARMRAVREAQIRKRNEAAGFDPEVPGSDVVQPPPAQ